VEALSKAVEADRWHEGIPMSPSCCTPGNSRLVEEGELRRLEPTKQLEQHPDADMGL
jgi:hypothetical protein